jgi:hypothetical protein
MSVILADLDLPAHQQAILRLLDMHCRRFGAAALPARRARS